MSIHLSEAMRLGAMMRPQAYGARRKTFRTSFLGLFGDKAEATCALGAAYEAGGVTIRPPTQSERQRVYASERGVPSPPSGITVVPNEWAGILWSYATCPVCSLPDICQRTITHLNDKHRWTREQIADFIESVERSFGLWDAATQPQPEETTK